MKIGVLTYHCSHNYGAFLQAYALVHNLADQTGHTVELIDFNMKLAEQTNRIMINFNRRQPESYLFNMMKYHMFQKSKQVYLPISSQKLVSDDISKFAEYVNDAHYDLIIVGSDEVWKMDGFRGFPNPYWLPGVHQCHKMAYAVSARNDYDLLPVEKIQQAEELIMQFEYIGVRDTSTQRLASSLCKQQTAIHLNSDPTFAYDFKIDKEAGKKILRDTFHVNPNRKCIGLMCGVPSLANQIIAQYQDRCEFVSLYYYYRHTKGFKALNPFEWINIIAALDGLVTTFFHGMVFALKGDTPFITIENRAVKDNSYSKNYDLLKRNGLENRCMHLEEKGVMEAIGSFIAAVCSNTVSRDFSKVRENESEMFQSALEFIAGL